MVLLLSGLFNKKNFCYLKYLFFNIKISNLFFGNFYTCILMIFTSKSCIHYPHPLFNSPIFVLLITPWVQVVPTTCSRAWTLHQGKVSLLAAISLKSLQSSACRSSAVQGGALYSPPSFMLNVDGLHLMQISCLLCLEGTVLQHPSPTSAYYDLSIPSLLSGEEKPVYMEIPSSNYI